MKKFYFLLYSTISVLGFSQTILNQSETTTRTVQDPNVVVLAPGFHATSSVSNPFVAKIGASTDTSGGGPNTPSTAGSSNPSGTTETETNRFHDTKGNIEVNGGGQLQFTLPIALPPGVKSVAPQVNLIYTSGGGNGIAGYGWNISGITAIARMGKTIETDGEVKGIQLDYSDYYSFNGQRLILKSGEYGKDDAEYATEKFSNIKIKSVGTISGQQWQGPEYWEVTFEDGSQAWYGATTTGGSNARTPMEYNIVKWKDGQGNIIYYTYEQINNVAVVKTIFWGGNETFGKPNFNEIAFNYIDRDLDEISYVKGTPFIQNKLLNEIVIKSNGVQFKKYIVKNDFKNGTNYQFVEKITEYNSNNEPANPVVFEYPTPTAANVEVLQSGTSDPFNTVKFTGDFNGDSYLDFIFSNGNVKLGAFNDSFTTINTNKYFNNTAVIVSSLIDEEGQIYNGNGVVQYESGKIIGYIFRDNVFVKIFEKLVYDTSNCIYEGGGIGCRINPTLKEGDINGDGISDIILGLEREECYWAPIPGCEENPTAQKGNAVAAPPVCHEMQCTTYPIGDFIIDLKNQNLPYATYTTQGSPPLGYSDSKYIDVDADGKVDVLNMTNSTYTVFEFVKISPNQYLKKIKFTSNLIETTQPEFPVLYGDFNGDGKLDFTIPITDTAIGKADDWRFYIGTGTGFNNFEKKEFFTFRKRQTDQNNSYVFYAKQFFYSVADINKDGKSDVISVFSYNQLNRMNDSFRKYGYVVTSKLANGSQANQNIDFTPGLTYQSPQYTVLGSTDLDLFIPLTNPIKANNNYYNVFLYWKETLHKLKAPTSLSELARVKSIFQNNLSTSINYLELNPDVNPNFYKKEKKEYYPYFSLKRVDQTFTVSQLIQSGRKQDFRYRGMTAHLQGKGMIGFVQVARSSFYVDGMENTKIWNGSETDPQKFGLPIKEWSVKTNDENQIFPADISVNNTQLLTFKQTQYSVQQLANKVDVILPNEVTEKDFLKNVTSKSTIIYGDYYLPIFTEGNIENGFAIKTTEMLYTHNPAGIGKDYYIGRPLSKTESMTVYSDTKKSKEEYTYFENLIKTKKSYNRNDTGWFLETYEHDGFGNIKEKVITSSIDGNSKTDKAEYESKGRFVTKKTDNLGLKTLITYNNWGQIETQTDPLGNILTNTYDNWGKLLKSKTNLGGTTTFTYEKNFMGDAVVTEYSPDGDVKISYTNNLGQNYRSLTKKFGQGQYVAGSVMYDGIGRKIKTAEPFIEYSGNVKWNIIEYDDYSRPIKATSFTGKEVVTSYSGRTATVTETNANNRFKKQTADPLGNIISSEDMGGIINFKFNAAGENFEANYEGNIVKTSYDAWGNKIRFEDPSNGVYEYEYKGYFGAISKTISPKGEKTYEYNNLGQLVKQKEKTKTGTGTDKTINFAYNDKGLITGKSGTSSGKSFSSGITYDSFGRVLSSYEDSNGKYFMKKGITYDEMMRVTSYEKSLYSSGILTKVALENVYDAWNGELSKVKEKGTGKILWELQQVNEKGQVTQAKLGAVNILNTYAANGFLNNINHSNTAGNTILQIGYSFNAIKNELNTRTTGGDFNIIEQFEYDDNNRLVNWTDPSTGVFTQNQKRNIYDNKGRITGNDQIGTIGFGNNLKKYQATSMTLNTRGTENYTNDLLQKITYNENNDPIFIDGVKGDVAFEYGLTSMRQKVTYGGNFAEDAQGKFTKYYSEDGSYEIIRNNQTGQEKHLIYIGGSPYESNIIYLKEFNTNTPKFVFLHKDYLGSILAITDEAGTKLEQRHFDAWGNLTHLKIGTQTTITDKNQIRDYLSAGNLVVDRGYTSHEHFAEVGLIHMNGRLYDPLLRRFLNADENIQDPHNTQNYNKYGYVMNNPLMYNDPSGECLLPLFGYLVSAWIAGAAVGVMVAAGMYIIKSLVTGSWSWGGFAKSLLIGAITGGAGGQLLGMYSATTFNGAVVLGSMNGAIGGGVEAIFNGNNFFTGLYRGAVMGGAMAGLSNAIYSLCNNNSYYVYDNGPTNANSSITPYEANYNIQKTKLQLFGDTDVGTYGVKGYHYDPDLPEGVVARTQISRFSRKSEIFFLNKRY